VEYLRGQIWQPIGAEADAIGAVDTQGRNTPFRFHATLRDYGRLGR